VYSTCSIEAEENEAVVEEFLAGTPSAQLEPARDFLDRSAPWCGRYVQTLPGRETGDGSFAARIRRGQQ
jgi:16S rRNA (cytosine967-C5)-methyltransferase